MLMEARSRHKGRQQVCHRQRKPIDGKKPLPLHPLRVSAIDHQPQGDGAGHPQDGLEAQPAIAVMEDEPAAYLPEVRVLCRGHMYEVVQDIFLKHRAQRPHRAEIY